MSGGGDCYDDRECRRGFCARNTCPGSCTAYVPLQGDCSAFDARCEPGMFCDFGTTPRRCVHMPGDGEGCYMSLFCADGLQCNDAGLCETPGASGFGAIGDGCGDGLPECNPANAWCDDETGQCAAYKAKGEACNQLSTNECGPSISHTCAGFVVDDSVNPPVITPGNCQPWSQEGGPCVAPPILVSGCATGLVCVNGQCANPPSSGPCAEGDLTGSIFSGGGLCDRSAYCDDQNQCAPRQAAGEACSRDVECLGRCIGTQCAALCAAP